MDNTGEGETLWINGTVRIGASDVATISAVEGPVNITCEKETKDFSGSRITPVKQHVTKVVWKIKISKPTLIGNMLKDILGMDKNTAGTLDDGATASTNYSYNLNSNYANSELTMLITGINDLTGKKIEVAAAKACLTSAFDIAMAKEDFTQPDMEFTCYGSAADPTDPPVEIREET